MIKIETRIDVNSRRSSVIPQVTLCSLLVWIWRRGKQSLWRVGQSILHEVVEAAFDVLLVEEGHGRVVEAEDVVVFIDVGDRRG